MNSAECTTVMVESGTGVTLRTVRWGNPAQASNVPLVLIHGLASNALLWEGAALEFAALGHAVVAVDLRGHGLSEKPDDGYDMQTVTNDVAGVLRVLASQGYERPVVAGQSWGGNVVIELALTHPELVRGVVAVDGGFLELQEHFPQWEECSVANFEHLPDGTIRPWLTLERHLKVLRGLWEHKPTHIYKDITVPVMFVPAEGPGGVFAETKRQAVERALHSVPKVRVEWFSPADHDLHAQHPVRFAQVVHTATTDGFFS